MRLQDIYNALLAGEEMDLGFDSKREADSFRVQLFAKKRREEKLFQELDFPLEKYSLRFSWNEEGSFARVKLVAPRPVTEFKVIARRDGDTDEKV